MESKVIPVNLALPPSKGERSCSSDHKYHFKSSNSEPEDSSIPSILSLNDDCMMQIFSYLSTNSLLEAEKVCGRWRSLIAPLWRRYKSLRVFFVSFAQKEPVHIYEFLERCSPYIEEVILHLMPLDSLEQETVIELLYTYCKNLTKLHIVRLKFGKLKDLKYMYCIAPKIQHLIFDDCDFLQYALKELLPSFNNLNVLEIWNHRKVVPIGQYILPSTCHTMVFNRCLLDLNGNKKALQLTKLTYTTNSMFHHNFSSNVVTLEKVLKLYPNIEDLTIYHETPEFRIDWVNGVFEKLTRVNFYNFFPLDDDLRVLAAMFPNVVSLRFNGGRNGNYFISKHNMVLVTAAGLRYLTRLPNLEELLCPVTNICFSTSSKSIEEFASDISPRLRAFEFRHSELPVNGILKLVEKNPKLSYICVRELVSFEMSFESFIQKLIDTLESRINSVKLVLVVGGDEVPTMHHPHPLLTINKKVFGFVAEETHRTFWSRQVCYLPDNFHRFDNMYDDESDSNQEYDEW